MGINIYTHYADLELKDILIDNDAYFNENILSCDFGELELEVMQKIDEASILDKEQGTIRTPRGITSIDKLSTGCKTILNYLSIIKKAVYEFKVINITQCGWNALEEIFEIEEVKNSGIRFLLLHKDNLHYCKERDYVINNDMHTKNLLFI
mgnify:CR=1 FL=1